MSKNFIFFAMRYLFTKHHDASITLMIKICFAGILVATCCLALVVSIMNGFEQATYKKMQSIYPDLIIATHDSPFESAHLTTLIANPHFGVLHASEQKNAKAFLCNVHDMQAPAMLLLHGIMPQDEALVSNIATKIINPKDATLPNLVRDDQILIGSVLAQTLDLEVGNQAYLMYCTDELTNLCMNFEQTKVTIAGIFKTGIDELDSNMAFCHQYFFNQLFDDQPIRYIHLRLKNIQEEQSTLKKIQQNLHCDIYSWKDLYPTLLSALKLEKYVMIFILFLIVFIASMNIVSLIQMYITQKKRDIAILLCFGMNQSAIQKIFITMSAIIAGIASLCGLMIALGIGIILQKYPCIKLPDNVYDSDFLPIQLELSVFSVIFMVTIIISVMASIFATRHIHKIKIVETLKTP